MTRTTYVTPEPVTLEGYQAVMKPSKFGYSLSAVVDQEMVDKLETERPAFQKWWDGKLKNPKRSVMKPEPWEEVAEGQFTVKFSWNEEMKPGIVDTEGTPIADVNTPLYSGCKVKLAFFQKPYVLKDKVTYGTSLKLQGVQVVTLSTSAGIDTGDMDDVDVAELFGTTKGFKTSEPAVTPVPEGEVDFWEYRDFDEMYDHYINGF